MKASKQLIMILVVMAAMPAYAGFFSFGDGDEEADLTAACVRKASLIRTPLAMECAEGDEEACDAKKAIANKKYDDDTCDVISKIHARMTRKK